MFPFSCPSFHCFSPPFTLQRLCELVIAPDKWGYSTTKRYVHAVEKVLAVTSYQDTLAPEAFSAALREQYDNMKAVKDKKKNGEEEDGLVGEDENSMVADQSHIATPRLEQSIEGMQGSSIHHEEVNQDADVLGEGANTQIESGQEGSVLVSGEHESTTAHLADTPEMDDGGLVEESFDNAPNSSSAMDVDN